MVTSRLFGGALALACAVLGLGPSGQAAGRPGSRPAVPTVVRLETAAAFVKAKMPLGQGNSLSDQDAYDVAAYFTQQPRPDFAAKDRDWSRGHKPADARY
jgi:hypothetical protein